MKIKSLTFITLLWMSSNLYAAQDTLNHANPMPNLVRYTMSHADELKLTSYQKDAIREWSKINKPKVNLLAKKVLLGETRLLKESLTTDADTLSKVEPILEARREIMQIKTICRTHLKEILTHEQYSKLVDVYIEDQYQKSGLIL